MTSILLNLSHHLTCPGSPSTWLTTLSFLNSFPSLGFCNPTLLIFLPPHTSSSSWPKLESAPGLNPHFSFHPDYSFLSCCPSGLGLHTVNLLMTGLLPAPFIQTTYPTSLHGYLLDMSNLTRPQMNSCFAQTCSLSSLLHFSKLYLYSPCCSALKLVIILDYSSSLVAHIQFSSKSCQFYLQNKSGA